MRALLIILKLKSADFEKKEIFKKKEELISIIGGKICKGCSGENCVNLEIIEVTDKDVDYLRNKQIIQELKK